MSRVVAILSGDVEVSTEFARPGYLTGWKFDDVSTLTITGTDHDIETDTSGDRSSCHNSLASTSMVGNMNTNAALSPGNARQAMLTNIIREGR